MSSNINIQRVCEYCNREFTARTTVTKYCSKTCNSRAYKARKRTLKVSKSNNETKKIKTKPIETIKAKEFLSINDVCILIGVSRSTVYRMFERNELSIIKIGTRTIIKRSELNKILKPTQKKKIKEKKGIIKYDIKDCYNIKEIEQKYKISRDTVSQLIKRHNLFFIRKGKYVYVPKVIIDKYLN